jgi:hypothetical protein
MQVVNFRLELLQVDAGKGNLWLRDGRITLMNLYDPVHPAALVYLSGLSGGGG